MKNRFLALFILSIILFTSCRIHFIRLFKFTKDLEKTTIVTQRNFKEVVKCRVDEYGLYINATLNGEIQPRALGFDTFADSWIDTDTKNNLNVKSKNLMSGKGGIGAVGATYISTRIGNIDFNKIPYMVMVNEQAGYETLAHGIIGVSLMQSFLWTLNFKDSTIIITDKLDSVKEYTNGYTINFQPRSSQKTPLLKLVINNTDTIDAIVDTGNEDFITLNSKFDTKEIKQVNPNSVATIVTNKNRLKKEQLNDSLYEWSFVKLNTLKMGNYEIKETYAIKTHGWDYGVIGMKFLKNFIVTIDWYNNNMYLKPIEGRETSINPTTYGFVCDLYYGKIRVISIFKNSIAEGLGLQSGDEIEMINGIEAKDNNRKVTFLLNEGKLGAEVAFKIKGKKNIIHLKNYNVFAN